MYRGILTSQKRISSFLKSQDCLIETSPVIRDNSRVRELVEFRNNNVIYNISTNMCTPLQFWQPSLRKNEEYDFVQPYLITRWALWQIPTDPTSRFSFRGTFPDFWLFMEWFILRTSLTFPSLLYCFKLPHSSIWLQDTYILVLYTFIVLLIPLIPIHSQLLDSEFQGSTYVDCQLPVDNVYR